MKIKPSTSKHSSVSSGQSSTAGFNTASELNQEPQSPIEYWSQEDIYEFIKTMPRDVKAEIFSNARAQIPRASSYETEDLIQESIYLLISGNIKWKKGTRIEEVFKSIIRSLELKWSHKNDLDYDYSVLEKYLFHDDPASIISAKSILGIFKDDAAAHGIIIGLVEGLSRQEMITRSGLNQQELESKIRGIRRKINDLQLDYPKKTTSQLLLNDDLLHISRYNRNVSSVLTRDALDNALQELKALYADKLGLDAVIETFARHASADSDSALDLGMGSAALAWTEAKAEILPSHPGAYIAAYLDKAGLSKPDAANKLGVTREHLYKVLRGDTSVSVEMARALEAAGTGIPAIGWMELQARFDLSKPKQPRINWSQPDATPVAMPSPTQPDNTDSTSTLVHPGTLIGKHLAKLGIPVSTAASRMGVSRTNLYQLMHGEIGISAEVAKGLEAIGTGVKATRWLELQAEYRLAHPSPRRPGRPRGGTDLVP